MRVAIDAADGDTLHHFVRGLPKAELHIHIEGSLEPELMFRLAERNKIPLPYQSVEEVRKAYEFDNLQTFLGIYYQGAHVLHSADDFYDLSTAYFRRLAADGGIHAELFFDPQTHTSRGVPLTAVFDGLLAGMVDSQRDLGISSKLILCFLRHLDEADAFAVLREAEPFLENIVGVGLDSSEVGHPPAKFAAVFKAARERGLKLVAHAGEEGPPAYIWEALDILGVDRIDHGNRALEDPDLVRRLAQDNMTLTVCPLSNVKLCVVDDVAHHPLKQMIDQGLKATVNSDDPAYFGGYLVDNYVAVSNALSLRKDEIVELARNSLSGSFLGATEKEAALARIDKYIASINCHIS